MPCSDESPGVRPVKRRVPDRNQALKRSTLERPVGFATPGLEQLLYVCAGYVFAQLIVLLTIHDPGDEDYLMFGAAGAITGVVLHLLVRGIGIRIPGIGKRFPVRRPVRHKSKFQDKDSLKAAVRSSRYRAALAVFRRPFKRRDRDSETPGNQQKIVKTPEGYSVGDRVFSRLAEAEDYLYVGSSPEGGGKKHQVVSAFAAQHSRRIPGPKARILKAAALAFALVLAGILLFYF